MSAPDEPAHTIKAASVARGQYGGTSSGVQGELLAVEVPKYIAEVGSYNCYATHPEITANCNKPTNTADRSPVKATTSAGNYNPVYYAIVGLGSRGLAGEPALYAMRIISAWLTSFFLAAFFYAASCMRKSRFMLIASAVSMTPAVLFLSGAVNPNALEIATTGAFYMGLCVMLENAAKSQTSWLTTAIVTTSGILLANTRPLSLLWLALAVVAAMIGQSRFALLALAKTKTFQLSVFLVSASCVFALWWTLAAHSLDSLFAVTPPLPADEAAILMLDRTVGYMREYVGVLGSLDTAPPVAVVDAWVLGFGWLLLLAFTTRPVKLRWPVAMVTVAVLAIPPLLQAASSETVGWIWQGRYALALIILLILVSGRAVRFRPFSTSPWSASLVRWSLVLGVLAHVYLLLQGLRRYTVGIHGDHINWTEMFEPQWQPPSSWQGLTVAYIIVLSVAGLCLYRLLITKPFAAQIERSISEFA
ncbi:DUF2142 domain-containing protein [Arthrobacter sp. ISL-85]|nr:DUF2142 domain-containing protein [Arthrobacter sp. ISL-85]